MSDTTTPSAAEVMGWLPPHEFCQTTDFPEPTCVWCDCFKDWPVATCPDNEMSRPTPDDMLAWLREQSYDVDVTGRRTHLAGDYLAGRGDVTVTLTAFRCDPESYTAPTLHAALEQAVIAVGRAE